MVNEHAYAPTLTDTARGNIRSVVSALMDATGLTETYLSKFLRGDSAFLKRLPETSMNLRTYDDVMARLSAAWPVGLAWPQDVPRLAPVALDDEDRRELEEMIARRLSLRAQEEVREARLRLKEARERAKAQGLDAREAREAAHTETAGAAAAPAQA